MSEQQIRLGAAVIATNKVLDVLMGRRGKEPNYGKWVFPGGGVKFGETLQDAARREFQEETGLEIDHFLGTPAPFIHEIMGPAEHRVIVFFCAHVEDTTPKAGSDLLEVRFITPTTYAAIVPGLSDAVRPVMHLWTGRVPSHWWTERVPSHWLPKGDA